jgi:hypothetical protein
MEVRSAAELGLEARSAVVLAHAQWELPEFPEPGSATDPSWAHPDFLVARADLVTAWHAAVDLALCLAAFRDGPRWPDRVVMRAYGLDDAVSAARLAQFPLAARLIYLACRLEDALSAAKSPSLPLAAAVASLNVLAADVHRALKAYGLWDVYNAAVQCGIIKQAVPLEERRRRIELYTIRAELHRQGHSGKSVAAAMSTVMLATQELGFPFLAQTKQTVDPGLSSGLEGLGHVIGPNANSLAVAMSALLLARFLHVTKQTAQPSALEALARALGRPASESDLERMKQKGIKAFLKHSFGLLELIREAPPTPAFDSALAAYIAEPLAELLPNRLRELVGHHDLRGVKDKLVSDFARLAGAGDTSGTGTSQELASGDAPALSPLGLTILKALKAKYPATVQQEDLATAVGRSRRTVGSELDTLREQGLISRPLGERMGDAITMKGLQILKSLDDALRASQNDAH